MGGNNNFLNNLRLRMGPSRRQELVAGFVLTKAPAAGRNLIEAALDESLRATDILFKRDMAKAMNRLHSFKAEKVLNLHRQARCQAHDPRRVARVALGPSIHHKVTIHGF